MKKIVSLQKPPVIEQISDSKLIDSNIRKCLSDKFEAIVEIIWKSFRYYKDIMPSASWAIYGTRETLTAYFKKEIDEKNVEFWGYENEGGLCAVMGIQHIKGVTLIRHSYAKEPGHGYGSKLIQHHKTRYSDMPIYVGCLEGMTRAKNFYEKHGFERVSVEERDRLRREYWDLPPEHNRQSVVYEIKKT